MFQVLLSLIVSWIGNGMFSNKRTNDTMVFVFKCTVFMFCCQSGWRLLLARWSGSKVPWCGDSLQGFPNASVDDGRSWGVRWSYMWYACVTHPQLFNNIYSLFPPLYYTNSLMFICCPCYQCGRTCVYFWVFTKCLTLQCHVQWLWTADHREVLEKLIRPVRQTVSYNNPIFASSAIYDYKWISRWGRPTSQWTESSGAAQVHRKCHTEPLFPDVTSDGCTRELWYVIRWNLYTNTLCLNPTLWQLRDRIVARAQILMFATHKVTYHSLSFFILFLSVFPKCTYDVLCLTLSWKFVTHQCCICLYVHILFWGLSYV